MASYTVFRIKDLVEIARRRQANKLDTVIAWVGKRGSGKSHGNYRFCRALGRYTINHLGTNYKAGGFKPERDMVYTRHEIIDLLKNRKFKPCMADEMINVAYNREFTSQDQQFLIKVLNQFRSNYNVFSMCNPFFYDLDPDLRSLVSIRIDIIRRGVGIVHFPNDSIYANDIWDTKYNQQIEKSWYKGKAFKPRYSKLTTFKGILVYPKLPPKVELKYEALRDLKRQAAARDLEGDTEAGFNIYENIINLALDKKLDLKGVEDICQANRLKLDVTIKRLNERLKNRGIQLSFKKLLEDQKKQMEKAKINDNLHDVLFNS